MDERDNDSQKATSNNERKELTASRCCEFMQALLPEVRSTAYQESLEPISRRQIFSKTR